MAARRSDRIAQWAFDTHPILDRFHLWLEDVEERPVEGAARSAEPEGAQRLFVGDGIGRALVMATAVTALGTRLFGRYGDGDGCDEATLNQVKKDADAVSSYLLSESFWYLTRQLPENHALMVSLGEGLMPKAGETADMGSNPLLGFGRVYARPQVARQLDRRVHRLLNEPGYDWEPFWEEIQHDGVTIWGAAVDTLEGTSRFAKGMPSGPMTVVHVFDQPLRVHAPYEGYLGTLVVPRELERAAVRRSVLLSFHTPRATVRELIAAVYPDIPAERIHVWTLGGSSREARLGDLWRAWRELGVDVVDSGWRIPGGGEVFTDSGTYAPVSRVGVTTDGDGARHLFLCDGYAASAEAIQAASLDPVYDTYTAMCFFSSKFALSTEHERHVMCLDPESERFAEELAAATDATLPAELVETYRQSIRDARDAGMPCAEHHLTIDDFLPKKRWRVVALSGHILDDPYTGAPGVEELANETFRVTVRCASRRDVRQVTLTLRLRETREESRFVFSPLLDRFAAGEDFRARPVKVSDSGRIRNELQTLASEALEYRAGDVLAIDFARVNEAVMSPQKKAKVREVLEWYKASHPIWFRWLEIAG